MRAVVAREGKLGVEDVAEPALRPDQIRVEPIAVGICAGDLAALERPHEFVQGHVEAGNAMGFAFDPDRELVLGHEFSSRVVEVGSEVDAYSPGDVIVTIPWVRDDRGTLRVVGYCNEYPGGLAERVVVGGSAHPKVPDGLSPVHAALVEPVSAGVNGVLRSQVDGSAGAVVLGCGPVGLGAIGVLVERGVQPIVAVDLSEKRRSLALLFGATEAIDPRQHDPVGVWLGLARSSQRLFLYEMAGKIDLSEMLEKAPPYPVVTVLGSGRVDAIARSTVIVKNLTVHYVAGPGPGEPPYPEYRAIRETLERFADGRIDPRPLITGYTGYEGASAAFSLKLHPDDPVGRDHIKVLLMPDRHDSVIMPPEGL